MAPEASLCREADMFSPPSTTCNTTSPRTSSRCTARPSDSGNKGINPNWTEKPTRTCPGGLKCDGKKGILVYGRLQR